MRTRAASVTAATSCAVLLAAVPAVLIHLAVWPAPELPSTAALRDWVRQPLTAGFLTGLAQVGAWLIWALLATTVLARAYTRVARLLRWLPTLHLPGPLQGLTAAVLGATAVTASTGAIPAHAATSGPGTTTAGEAAHPSPPTVASASSALTAASGTVATRAPSDRKNTYTVRQGNTLSDIAEQCLGDADRWPEIFALNRGTYFPGVGGTLRDPDVIYPGWTLDLPTATTPSASRQAPSAPKQNPPTERPDADEPHPGSDPPTTAPAHPTPATTAPDNPAPSPSTPPATDTPHGDSASPAPTSAATGQTPVTAHTDPDAPDEKRNPHGVCLPSGSWIDVGLALAIAAAVALVWAHRRRRYIPGRPHSLPRLSDPDLAPMPRVVNQIRRALRPAAADHSDTRNQDEDDRVRADVDGELKETNSQLRAVSTDGSASCQPLPLVPALAHPLSSVWPAAGLGLTGPGAQAAARGFLTAALAAGGTEHPDARTHVVIPSATAATLLGAAVTPPRTPRLTITADLDDALEILEAQALHRTRLLQQHEVDTVTDLRTADPYEEPLPPLMLLADVTGRHQRARIAALLTQGRRLDIHGVLLGAWPDGNTVDVADDGTTTPADGEGPRHGTHPADVGRLAVINPSETIDLLATLAESHTGQLPTPTPAEAAAIPRQATAPQPPRPVSPHDGGQPETQPAANAPAHPNNSIKGDRDDRDKGAADPTTNTSTPATDGVAADATATAGSFAAEAEAAASADATRSPTQVDTDETYTADHGAATTAPHPSERDTAACRPGRVTVAVLGAPDIVDGDPQRSLRAKSLELLVYLAVRDGTASVEAILDDLLPDAPASKAVHRLHTYVSDLRSVLRHNAGPGTYLIHPNHRYELNPERFDIDLWRMRAAIRAADTATSQPERITALRRVVDTYRQPLADGRDYEWLEPYREAVRKEALDAAVALTEELTDQPSEQLAVLETAIVQHPYAEGLYQAAMHARARLGDLDGVRALRRTVTRRLADIDAEPSDDTLTLADRLVAELRGPGHDRRTHRPPRQDGATA